MKKIERESVKYLILLMFFVALFGLIFYPLFDFVISKCFTNSEFVYSINSHVVQPIVFSVVFSTTFWLVSKKKNSK